MLFFSFFSSSNFSKKSFQGQFGNHTYGTSLYQSTAAFSKAKGDKDRRFGEKSQSPMLWALRLSVPTINLYNFSIYDHFYGISSKEAYEKDAILNIATYSADVEEEGLVPYLKKSISIISSQEDQGDDFNPIPFMNHVISHLNHQDLKNSIFLVLQFY